MTTLPRVLVADRDGPWRTALLAALLADGVQALGTTDSQLVAQALASPTPDPLAVVLGTELTPMCALDVLFHHHQSRKKPGAPALPKRSLIVVSESREDLEYLQLLRDRGAHGFVYREDAVDLLAAQLRSITFGSQRRSVRYPFKTDVELQLPTGSLHGHSTDFSENGMQVSVPLKKAAQTPGQGMRATILCTVEGVALQTLAIIRQIQVQTSFFGDKLLIGLQFDPDGFDSAKSVETALARIVQNHQSGDSLTSPRPPSLR
jgi:hypothetical protein